MSSDDFGDVPQMSEEMLQWLAAIEKQAAETVARRQALREKLVRYRPDGREELDAAQIFAALQTIFADAHQGLASEERPGRALWDATIAIEDADVIHGHIAGLMAHSITRGRGDAESVAAAHELVNSDVDDPRRKKLWRAVERVADYQINLTQFDRQMKGLLPIRRPVIPPISADARPLSTALKALTATLRRNGLTIESRPCLRDLWDPFHVFAQQPFKAKRPLFIENDMCLAEWVDEPDEKPPLRLHLVRQWSLSNIDDGSHDHMEQLHLVLHFNPEPERARPSAITLWSGDDIVAWASEVEATAAFQAFSETRPAQVQLFHTPV